MKREDGGGGEEPDEQPDPLDGYDPYEAAAKRFGITREEAIEISSANG